MSEVLSKILAAIFCIAVFVVMWSKSINNLSNYSIVDTLIWLVVLGIGYLLFKLFNKK